MEGNEKKKKEYGVCCPHCHSKFKATIGTKKEIVATFPRQDGSVFKIYDNVKTIVPIVPI